MGTFIHLLCSLWVSAGIETKIVTPLDSFEPFEAHLFHSKVLWVGKSRSNIYADYRLEAYEPTGVLKASTKLNHSVRHLYAYGDGKILAVGISTSGMSHYSIATLQRNQLVVTAREIPAEALASEWAGTPGKHVFTDPGGEVDTAVLGQPSKTFFTLGAGGGVRFFPTRLAGPFNPLTVRGELFVIQHPFVGGGGRAIVRVPLESGPQKIADGQDFSKMVVEVSTGLLVVSDRKARNVRWIELSSGQTVDSISIPDGTPRGLAILNSCLVVGMEREKKIRFYRKAEKQVQVAEWILEGVGAPLRGIRNLAADSESATLFIRSAYPASIGDPGATGDTVNAVIMMRDPSGNTARLCG